MNFLNSLLLSIMRAIHTVINNYALTIIIFTLLIKLVVMPLNLKSRRSTMRMTSVQPTLKALQDKYKDDQEKLDNLIKAIDELKERVGIKKTIKDYGIDEKNFLDRLDEMVEQAFDDQCTGANPRYPLMSEIKQMYLNAYYGTKEKV